MNDNFSWPEGKRCAAVISVLFDDGLDAVAKAPDLLNRSKSFSVWQYGANRGVERLGATFARYGTPTSWFVPACVASRHAGLIRALAQDGHDIECHGQDFEHHDVMSVEESLQALLQARQTIAETSGKLPTGFRLPQGNWPQDFDNLLSTVGFQWSASLNGDDLPYFHRSGLVEVPVHIELEDRPYMQFNFTPAFPKGQSRLPSYEAVLDNWIAEFDAYRQYGLCFVLQIRPEMIGTPGRIFILEKLLQHIQQFDDVWLAKGAAVADWWRTHGHPLEAHHPLNVFSDYQQECHASR
jgi:peptidoglycan/xylan/chitin deacetylase (PgdA/CDA1 family)